MSKEISMKKNMLMSVILNSANFIFPLITYFYVARVILPEGTGKVAFVQSVLAYFSYIATLGISGYGQRECARVRDDKEKLSKLTMELLTLNLISTLVAYVALVIAIFAVPKFRDYTPLFIVMSSSMLLQTLGMEWLYQGLEQYTYITVRSLIFKIIAVALTFLLIKGRNDYVIYGALTVFTSSASYLLNFLNAKKYLHVKKYANFYPLKHLKPVMVFFASSIIITIYGHFDSTMLGFMVGDTEVGLYNSALKMKSVVVSFSTGITSVLVPRMSVYIGKGEKDKFLSLIEKSARIALLLVFPVSVFVITEASDVLEFVCGNEYLAAYPTLIVLMVCTLMLAMTNLFGNQVLVPKGQEKIYSKSVFCGLWINLILNFILIPFFTSVGAAVATLATEMFNACYMGYHCKEEALYLKNNIKIRQYLIPLLISVTLDFIVKAYIPAIDSAFWRLTVHACIIIGLYWVVLIIVKEPLIDVFIKQLRKKYNGKKK